jgi:hypothetical protein
VGTVLSLWDAAELDAAGQDGEVLPKFINLTDASIKMVCDQIILTIGSILINADRVSANTIRQRATTTKRIEHIYSRKE